MRRGYLDCLLRMSRFVPSLTSTLLPLRILPRQRAAAMGMMSIAR
jgi:hypothetical protein